MLFCLSVLPFFGFDLKLGQDYVRNYDDVCIRVINLVREIETIRCMYLDLNVIVRDFTT